MMNRMNPNQAVSNVPSQTTQGGMPNQMAVGGIGNQTQLPNPTVNPGVQVSMGQNAGQMNPAGKLCKWQAAPSETKKNISLS